MRYYSVYAYEHEYRRRPYREALEFDNIEEARREAKRLANATGIEHLIDVHWPSRDRDLGDRKSFATVFPDKTRRNPDTEGNLPPDFEDAVKGYRRFHSGTSQRTNPPGKVHGDPREIGTFTGLVIPRTVTCVGEGVHVLYRSDKWGDGIQDYIHEHEGGVYACRADADAEGFEVDVPTAATKATSLYLLGDCLGLRYVTEESETADMKTKRPLPELYSTPNGKVLLIIEVHESRAKVVAALWGGKLDVRPEGIVG